MGGVGKTTLANVLYNKFSSQFEGCYFLANGKDEAEKHGLINLRNKLLAKLLEEDDLSISTPYLRLSFIKERFRRKRVLIVLDDLNTSNQLESLAGHRDWFGFGTRIIVTSGDVQVLRNGADVIYKLEGLHFDEALQLFHSNAFKRNSSTKDYIELSKRVVKYAKGVPLALKVLGSCLHSKTTKEWELALDKLQVVPNMEIQMF